MFSRPFWPLWLFGQPLQSLQPYCCYSLCRLCTLCGLLAFVAFAAFAAFTDALLAYAQKHPVSDFQTTPQPATPPRLGTCLQEAGLITAAQLNAALAEQQVAHQRLGEILSGHGWVKQETVDYLANTVIARDAHQPDTPPKTLALSH